jgi:hypothetical protein
LKEDGEMPRWIPLKNISSDEMTFPVDKIVAEKLKII